MMVDTMRCLHQGSRIEKAPSSNYASLLNAEANKSFQINSLAIELRPSVNLVSF